MTTIKEKDFIRLFILELMLAKKESAFDLWDDEIIDLPHDYIIILDQVTFTEDKQLKYQQLIPTINKEEWKYKINDELNDFLKSTGVSHSNQENFIRINLNRTAISKIMFNQQFDYSLKGKMACLAEDFLIKKTKEKNKVLINKR